MKEGSLIAIALTGVLLLSAFGMANGTNPAEGITGAAAMPATGDDSVATGTSSVETYALCAKTTSRGRGRLSSAPSTDSPTSTSPRLAYYATRPRSATPSSRSSATTQASSSPSC